MGKKIQKFRWTQTRCALLTRRRSELTGQKQPRASFVSSQLSIFCWANFKFFLPLVFSFFFFSFLRPAPDKQALLPFGWRAATPTASNSSVSLMHPLTFNKLRGEKKKKQSSGSAKKVPSKVLRLAAFCNVSWAGKRKGKKKGENNLSRSPELPV